MFEALTSSERDILQRKLLRAGDLLAQDRQRTEWERLADAAAIEIYGLRGDLLEATLTDPFPADEQKRLAAEDAAMIAAQDKIIASHADDQTETKVNGETHWTPAIRELFAQGKTEPGTEAWWPIWGALAQDVRPGDIVMIKWSDGEDHGVDTWEVAGFARRGEGHSLHDQIRPRFTDPDGELFSIGVLQTIKLFRKGTHNTLADSI